MMNIFRRNIKIKLISICFAFIMWIYVMAVEDPILIRDFTAVPIKITNLSMIKDKNIVVTPNQNLDVNLIIRGRRSILKNIDESKLMIYGKIKNPKLGYNYIKLNVDVPENIEYSIIPSGIGLNLEQKIHVRKNIEIYKNGKPQKNMEISNLNLKPQYTFIEGPKSLINKVDKLVCKINLENKSSNFNTKSRIIPIDKNGEEVEGLKLRDKYAFFDIGMFKTKEVPVKINFKNTLDKNYKIMSMNTSISKVNITGPAKDIDKINEIYTENITLSNLNIYKNINTKIIIPQNVKCNINTLNVNFGIAKLISKDFLISKNRINFTNNIQNLDISKNDLPENIKVNVEFYDNLEKEVNENTIQLYVNMQESIPENSKYEIKCNIQYPIEKVEIEPKFVIISK